RRIEKTATASSTSIVGSRGRPDALMKASTGICSRWSIMISGPKRAWKDNGPDCHGDQATPTNLPQTLVSHSLTGVALERLAQKRRTPTDGAARVSRLKERREQAMPRLITLLIESSQIE